MWFMFVKCFSLKQHVGASTKQHMKMKVNVNGRDFNKQVMRRIPVPLGGE